MSTERESSDMGSEHSSADHSSVELLQELPGDDQDAMTRSYNWVRDLVDEIGGMDFYFPIPVREIPLPENLLEIEESLPLLETARDSPPPTLSDSEDEEPVVTRYVIAAGSVMFQRLIRGSAEAVTNKKVN